MKIPRRLSIFGYSFAALIALTADLAAQSILQIEEPDENVGYNWTDDWIWSDGSVPSDGSDVEMPAQSNESGPVDVFILLDDGPVTLQSFTIDYGVDLTVSDTNFTVTGDTSATGFFTIRNGTMSLGTNVFYDAPTKTLNNGQCLVDDSGTGQGILQWHGADIEINKAGFNLFGTNVVVRNQDNGIDAFHNLKRNEGFLTMDDGYVMHVNGNFTNTDSGSITLNLNQSVRTPQLIVGGNFVNDGEVELRGNTVLNVAGGYSGSGTITSFGSQNQISVAGAYVQNGGNITVSDGNKMTLDGDLTVENTLIILKGDGTEITVAGDILVTGGTVDTGPSGVDSTVLKARTGVYQNNATISGEGKLVMDVTVNNSYITPGNTPGKLRIEGNLSITGTSDLEIELAGTTAGDSYDVLAQSGGTAGVALGGTLTVKLTDSFECDLLGTDSFTVVTSDMPLAGVFTNVANGARLATADGLGTFLVTYGAGSASPNAVVLSDFLANPVAPQTFAEWALANDFPPGKDGPLDDADGDGVGNLIEYAFGQCRTPGQPQAKVAAGNLVVTYSMPKSVTGLTVTSLVSPTMESGSWTPGPAPQSAGTTAAKDVFTVTIPYNPANPQFVRLKIEEG